MLVCRLSGCIYIATGRAAPASPDSNTSPEDSILNGPDLAPLVDPERGGGGGGRRQGCGCVCRNVVDGGKLERWK